MSLPWTTDVQAAWTRSQAVGARSQTLARGLAVAAVVLLWALMRPYPGIEFDARIYVGRALANLHPDSIGRELAFVHDGQSGFSVFSRIMTPAAALLGPGAGAMAMTIVGLALWLGAAAFLLSRFHRGALLWAGLVCVAAFPPAYGGFAMFEWGEAIATPRIFAEAAGLAALGFLVSGGWLAALALAAVAAAFHPLMALPMAGVGLLWLGLRDRRWLLLPAAGALAVLAAAAAGVPMAARLLAPIDQEWLRIIADRSPQVLPGHWPVSAWGLPICQAATLLLAANVSSEPLRRLLAASLLVAAAGTLAGLIWPSVLIAQLQLWRAQWLMSYLAAALFAACATGLWGRGDKGRLALIFLAAAWLGRENPLFAAFACAAAGALRFGWPRSELPPSVMRLAILLFAVFAAVVLIGQIGVVGRGFAGLPAEYWLSVSTWQRTALFSLPFGAAAVAAATGVLRLDGPRMRAAAMLGVALLAAMLALTWDDRREILRAKEAGAGAEVLRARLTDGAVFGLDSSGTTWLWTGRPEWWSQTQGSGVVFDRGLAIEWDRRLGVLIQAGLLTPADRRIYSERRATDPQVTARGLDVLCRTRDAPRWVIAPAGRTDAGLARRAALTWRSPAPEHQRAAHGIAVAQDFVVFDCRTFSS
jgi:hypothetical protein